MHYARCSARIGNAVNSQLATSGSASTMGFATAGAEAEKRLRSGLPVDEPGLFLTEPSG